jgi:AraC-like DNA-binding protein
MNFNFDERLSDSPFVEKVWQTHSDRPGSFISAAASQWEMVVTTYQGKTTLTVRGPETKASPADCPADAEFFGIIFKLGTFMPHLPLRKLLDRKDATLPEATSRSFWLHGAAWQFPDFENADTFVARLERAELLVREPVVEAVLQNRPLELSLRSVQRRFLHATGLTRGTLDQIERAREAVTLLEQGGSIADAVYHAGYADQPHLTRSLKRFAGQTPAQILRSSTSEFDFVQF